MEKIATKSLASSPLNCFLFTSTESRSGSPGNVSGDPVIFLTLARDFLPLYERVKGMRDRGTFESYLQLLYLSLIDTHSEEDIPWYKATLAVEELVCDVLC